jgi:glycosyltransferase involved in cell wall biosynthesis
VSLVVIGRKKEGGVSARTIDELGLNDCVTFVTGVPEKRIIELYSEAEVAVVPSLYEGFSLPAIEAMACGVPLVATTGGALPEVVGPDGIAALTVPPNDPSELALAIGRMLDNPELRARIGRAGRDRILDRFTWRRSAEGMIENWYAALEAQERTAC